MAEIPVRPKRGADLPVQPKRRPTIWPWALGLLALVLLPLLFMRDDNREDTATLPDTAALTDTTGRFGGRTTGTAAGAVATDTGSTVRAGASTRRDTAARGDTTLRSDTTARIDTTSRR